jgi:peptide/nickel transport system substrate-binding protein
MSHRIVGLFLLLVVVMAAAGCAAPASPAQVAAPTVAAVQEPATVPAQEPTAPVTAEAAPTEAPAPESASGGVLVRALTSEPAQIDPQGAPSSGLSVVLPYLFDTLVVRDLDNALVPALAESWEVSEDGKAITMKLRSDVTFHDGTPLNAEAVKFTFERFKESGQASPIYPGVQQIGGVEVLDEHTVRFTFDAPAANFWSTISMPYAAIISPASAQTVSEQGEGHLIGSGPFRLGEWKSGQSMTLEKNPEYVWGPAIVDNRKAPLLDQMILKVIPDAATQLAEAGDGCGVHQPTGTPGEVGDQSRCAFGGNRPQQPDLSGL